MSAAAGDRVGRFALTRRLGAGGMGEVWEAHDPELDRQVAIKLLRASGSHARVAREARAMAKLNHPAVVTVYDVGDDRGRVWIAMELAPGGTLRRWLEQRPRTWREVVAAFAVAGRGLAAAHAAGLVHRDFKPDNVLVRGNGQLVVADFGLARAGDDVEPSGDGDGPVAATSRPPIGGDDPTLESDGVEPAPRGDGGLTRTGAIVGTPPYMAPEQHLGRPVDARADQFAFAVALWEAVFCQHPFAVDDERRADPASWSLAIIHGRRRPPPRSVVVPRWLRVALDRGLAIERDARFPDMDALVGALDRGLRRRRRATIAAVALGALASTAAATALVWPQPAAAAPCRSAAARMHGVWDPARRAELEAGFAATGAGFAADAFTRVAAALDARRDQWVAMHTEACEATHVHHTQSAALLDRRMACLDERHLELGALVDALRAPDRAGVAAAQQAIAGMPALDRCDDDALLEASSPLPADPQQRARIAALRAELADAHARGVLGAWLDEADRAAAVAVEAEQLAMPSLLASARYSEGYAATQLDDLARARTALTAAATAAGDAHDDATAAGAWTQLVEIHANLGELDEARALLPVAEAATRRAGNPARLRHEVMQATAGIAMVAGDLAAARAQLIASLAFVEAELADDPTSLMQALGNLARVESGLELHAEAIAHAERALAVARTTGSEDHPTVASYLADLGRIQRVAGDLPTARATLERALASLERSYGPDAVQLVSVLVSLGNAESQAGEHAAALAHLERAVANAGAAAGTGQLEGALRALGVARSAAGDEPGAREALGRVLPVIAQRVGKDTLEYAFTEYNHAIQLECAPGRAELEHAGDIFTARLGAAHPATLSSRFALAQCLIDVDPAAAAAATTAVLDACQAAECPPMLVAASRSVFGQVEWTLGRHAEAIAAIRQARAEFIAMGADGRAQVAELDGWLRKHRR